ncbi:transposase [Ramlibacter sp.]
MDHLSRYTDRTAIEDEQLQGIQRDHLLLRLRADDSGRRRVAIPGSEFIARLLQHVLPPGFVTRVALDMPGATARLRGCGPGNDAAASPQHPSCTARSTRRRRSCPQVPERHTFIARTDG